MNASPAPAAVNTNNGNKIGTTHPTPPTAPESKVVKKAEKTKPITISLSEDLHRKLKIVGFAKGMPISDVVAVYVQASLKRDLGVALSKLTADD